MTVTDPTTFGSGGAEPYDRALRDDDRVLYLRESGDGEEAASVMPLKRWTEAASAVDIDLLRTSAGSVLDIGCGPGRMVRAALDLGRHALGIDVSAAAVSLAHRSALPVVRRSVFDPLPGEGAWGAALLVDGNIGIGGDVSSLLRRTSELISPDGSVLVEVDSDPHCDRSYFGTITDSSGRQSDAFPWAQVGADALARYAHPLGLGAVRHWVVAGRFFCRLIRA